ncbi:quinone-dependent dihydroorotate dehydrogenase [Glaciecola sp. HTCC2999]|uniref:quinone-dependent dihydroorotate dehydrogenase n=1 Tax=Glaciecola sp. HTCC2999 TaxID=455436 RepID=UPI0000E10B9D|nr:quinone-dependent dihydroorotate dehydrogenase [Glaciecola sp. HTCC2999]
MFSLAHKALLQCDAEFAHDMTIGWLAKTQRSFLKHTYQQTIQDKPVSLWGLEFPNPVGLAAGLDKEGQCIDAFNAMGFGFVEIGTVTPVGQPGNPKPRLFRLPEKNAIINRMGFNNLGVDNLLNNVAKANNKGVLGINIGKNKHTEEANALSDYLICLRKVYAAADYITVNISSPNTPGLRNLQYGETLNQLLSGLKSAQLELSEQHDKYTPIALKIAPDLTHDELLGIADALVDAQLDGVIATNTTLSRDAVAGLPNADEMGGLSGSVLTERSLEVTQQLSEHLQGALPIISVGGIDSAAAAQARLDAGASLVQVYSALIYQGPKLIPTIVNGLS